MRSLGARLASSSRFVVPVETCGCRGQLEPISFLPQRADQVSEGFRQCHLGRPIRVTRGAYLYRDGDLVGDRLFLVHYGAFKTGRQDHHGRTCIASFQLQHDMLALNAIGLAPVSRGEWSCSC